jgi:hypothetical protein
VVACGSGDGEGCVAGGREDRGRELEGVELVVVVADRLLVVTTRAGAEVVANVCNAGGLEADGAAATDRGAPGGTEDGADDAPDVDVTERADGGREEDRGLATGPERIPNPPGAAGGALEAGRPGGPATYLPGGDGRNCHRPVPSTDGSTTNAPRETTSPPSRIAHNDTSNSPTPSGRGIENLSDKVNRACAPDMRNVLSRAQLVQPDTDLSAARTRQDLLHAEPASVKSASSDPGSRGSGISFALMPSSTRARAVSSILMPRSPSPAVGSF